ncbi:MAG: M23 family metallopeptidase [Lachnospiraceae bacterium]|nr:M23 family metallopeptidase [Lachnospiraceae bacterium]
MNRRTWKEFITKRSTIWSLSLCLVGAIVLGGIAAVNSSRKGDDTQPETGTGQVAYLEEDLNSTDDDSRISTDAADDTDSVLADAADTSGSILADATDTSGSILADTTDSSLADTTNSSDSLLTDTADGLEEASGTTTEENTSNSQTEYTSDDYLSGSDTDDSSDTVSSNSITNDNVDSEAADDLTEASSANIISEQTLLEAGVSFSDEQSLLWPSAGTIAIDYSMDKSVYFATLNQYKYNPALVISSETGNQVLASAKGIVESITIDEETGTTLVLNIGNGYKLTYGQLMEPAVSEGDVVEAGDLLAYISEPTKYYSTEGSNLYFAMTKDGEPVDPVLYLE